MNEITNKSDVFWREPLWMRTWFLVVSGFWFGLLLYLAQTPTR